MICNFDVRFIPVYCVDVNMFHVEKMEPKDYSFAIELSNTLDWKMTIKDFEFMCTVEPLGCFVLYDDLEKLGVVTCVSFDRIGWFGNFIVKKEYRDQGAGSFLLQKAITYLKNKGVQTIGLYSYPELTDFYEKFGFKKNDEFIIFQGNPSPLIDLEVVTIAEKNDFSKILNFDRVCLGFNRDKTLNLIFSDKNNIIYFLNQGNFLKGYVVTKIYGYLAEIGPLVSRSNSESVGVKLLTKAMNNLSSCNILIYVPKN